MSDPQKTLLLLAPLLLFGLVSLVNEACGVTLSDNTISFPIRIFDGLPLLTLGRKALSLDDIYHFEIFKDGDIQKCVIITNQLRGFGIYFPGKSKRNEFFRTMIKNDREFNIIESSEPSPLWTSKPINAGVNIIVALTASTLLVAPHLASKITDEHTLARAGKNESARTSRDRVDEPEEMQYILHAASYNYATTSRKKVEKSLVEIQKCSGVQLQITTNSNFKFISPIKKWLITAGPFPESKANDVMKKLVSCGTIDATLVEAEIEQE